ncbi:DUF1810 domain-containing protein [Pedobacter agri]|uniref:DUF1810 domain-containing protein n=1 Tax=Pedobacter agri TaxID=454586 RepID=UPI00292FC71A|nr:DUF1810 domain-containing protein [Pedobacter agri]
MKSLERFITAQHDSYEQALSEIKGGRKTSHWMWYIFPQIKGLGHSDTAKYYALQNTLEAENYLNHPVLGKRLIEISSTLLKHQGKTANEIFGYPDDLKLHSSMTLFSLLPNSDPVFDNVLLAYFNGIGDQKTIEICSA